MKSTYNITAILFRENLNKMRVIYSNYSILKSPANLEEHIKYFLLYQVFSLSTISLCQSFLDFFLSLHVKMTIIADKFALVFSLLQ